MCTQFFDTQGNKNIEGAKLFSPRFHFMYLSSASEAMSMSASFHTRSNRCLHCHCSENRGPVFPSKACSERSICQRQGRGAKVQMPRLLELLQHSYMYSVDECYHETQRYLASPDSDTGYSSIHAEVQASSVITPYTFKPVVLCSEELLSLRSSTTPPQSPVELKKVSPTPSTRTMTTVESSESLPSAFDCIHIPSSPTFSTFSHSDETSESRSVWIPPRAISVRHFLDTKNIAYDQNRNKSPSDDSSTPKKSQLFSTREEDPTRKSRVKTELCMHYIKRTPCPFGSHCTYAHGEDELQLTKLMDLHRAGLADCETYRTKPCLTWVSTGSWYVKLLSGKKGSDDFGKSSLIFLTPFLSYLVLFLHSVRLENDALVFTTLELLEVCSHGYLIPRLKAILLLQT